jgi:predicted molibdopterin-dependent oxidoreductase YjgC
LEAAATDGLDVLYLVGGNHLETMPDRLHAERGLTNVKLRVHQDIVLNTTTLLDAREAVVLLPAETRYEQRSGGTSTSTERRIRFTPEIQGPRIGEAKPEWEIPALVGQRLDRARSDLFGYADTAAIRSEMNALIPLYSGIHELCKEGDWVQWGGPRLGAEGFVNMPEGRALFSVVDIPRIDVPAGRFLLTLRRGKQFNSMTHGRRDPLTRGSERTALLLDERDMVELGLSDGERIVVESEHGRMDATARSGPCRRRHVQGFWPEGNVLIGRKYDPVSGEPDYATTVDIRSARTSQ